MVDIAISFASSFVSKVAEYSVTPIGRQIGYIWNYNSNFDDLKEEIEKLKHKKGTVQHDVDTARRQGEEIEQPVNVWLENVIKMIDEASTVVGEKEQGNTKCFKGFCPNPKKRYQYGRKAAKKVKAVAELRGEGNFPQVRIPSHGGYGAFELRESILKEIQNALVDPNINMIGVHGPGGIGKTTLVRKAAEYAKNNKHFNVVAFAEVKAKPDIENIQQEIADWLGLQFNQESLPGRAMRLQARLKKEEKVLLVLDNIWERLSLEEVGIPFGDDHKGCKLLLTARDLKALSLTGSGHNISMDFLNDQESWTLFSTTVGNCVEQSDELQNLAKDVVKACKGLPIAIVTIAAALKNENDVSKWRTALRQLKKPSSSTLEGVAGETFSCIEFSYNQLKGEELRAIFLLCCVMKSTYYVSVRDLVVYVWGLGVFETADRIEEVRDQVRTLVQRLKDASLLLDAPDNKSFWMHDVVRDVGRLIASKNQHVVEVMNDNIGRDWYDDDALKTSTRIFLKNVIELPEELKCPNLQLLYMEGTNALKIPDNFFTGMPKIRVLHLSEFHLSSLPTSLCQLVDLRTLRMDRCRVKDLALIGKLKRLESLSIVDYWIEDYGIKRLPEEICELTRLRFLDVGGCFNLEDIPPNVISRLTQLEELYLGDRYIQWEDQKGSNVLSKGLFTKKLERYDVSIGETIEKNRFRSFWMRHEKKSRRLKLSRFRDVHHKMQSVKKVVSALDGGEGFPNLEQLCVEGSSFFHTVGDCSELNSCDPFPCLETLILDELNNLETIYNGQLGAKNLCHLVSIKVFNSPKLKNVFSFSTSRALPLQEIEVCDCANMTEIFAIGGEEDIIQLKELRSLTLTSLPQLTSFCSINDNKVIAEDKRDTPTPFFNVTVMFPKLERITISDLDNVETIWENQLAKYSFNSLKSVKISRCRSLKSLFPASIAKELLLFEELTVSECGQLVEIVAKDGVDMEAVTVLDFPRLTSLIFSGLPQLRYFYHGTANWPALNKLKMADCQKIGSFASAETNINCQSNIRALFFVKNVELPTVASSSLSSIGIQTMWHNQQQSVSSCFRNLMELTFEDCDNLKYLSSSSIIDSFVQLYFLKISNCKSMVRVIDIDEVQISNTLFPKLNRLILKDLLQLRTFCCFAGNSVQLPSLAKLTIMRCPKMRTFAFDSCADMTAVEHFEEVNTEENLHSFFHEKVAIPCLNELTLWQLPELLHLWKGSSQPGNVFENLEHLNVAGCDKLQVLVPSSVSLRNLMTLIVQHCDGLINLVTFSTAKSLEQLKIMHITYCKMIKAIIMDMGNEPKDGIVFNQLEYLKLCRLPSLTSFSIGNFAIEFPYLQLVFLIECLRMMNFSQGVPRTPMLHRLDISEKDGGYWEGDLNTTTQKLFKNLVCIHQFFQSSLHLCYLCFA